jgi:acetyl esterase
MRVPPEKQLSEGQVRRRVGLFRTMTVVTAKTGRLLRKTHGAELFLDTEAGRVRVLAYGLDRQERLPLFVDLHGGGFVIGDPEMEDPFLPAISEKAGVKILSVDYSLAPEHPFPEALDECYAVVKYAKDHPDELGIDPERLAVGGHSAGGNLGAAVCLVDNERHELALKALILDYPPLDLHTDPYLKPRPKKAIPPRMARLFDRAYAGTREAAKNPLISPAFATDDELRNFPPTLMISASFDSLAEEETVFKDRLGSLAVPVVHRLFEDARHGFTLFRGPQADEAWQMMVDFLRRHLSASEATGR